MKKLMILAVLLSLVLVSCEKKPVEPETEMIEVSFNASLYELDFQTNLKSVPGYPDIPHRTDLNFYDGRIVLQNIDKDYQLDLQCEVGEFDTITFLLEAGDYRFDAAWFNDFDMQRYNNFWQEVRNYIGSCIISNTSVPDHIIYSIDNENSQINFEIASQYGNCYVFSDPNNLIKEITDKGDSEGSGILKSQMNTIDYDGETFYYCYHTISNLWIYTTDGRLTLDFGDYYDSLDEEDKYYYTAENGFTSNYHPKPFTVYATITPSITENIKTAFTVSSVYSNVEVEIPLE